MHGLAILEDGLKWQQTTVDPLKAQSLESRKFQTIEIARWLNIPPHFLKDLERATFSNIEHQGIEFVIYSLRPRLVRWEQRILVDLIPREEQDDVFAEFLVDGLLRGDLKSRYDAYAVGRQNGWLSANDVLELENRNPIENGDIYLQPVNYVEAGTDLQGQQQTREAPLLALIERQAKATEAIAARPQPDTIVNVAPAAVKVDTAAPEVIVNVQNHPPKRGKIVQSHTRDSKGQLLSSVSEFVEETP